MLAVKKIANGAAVQKKIRSRRQGLQIRMRSLTYARETLRVIA